jgi:hypothetical protein
MNFTRGSIKKYFFKITILRGRQVTVRHIPWPFIRPKNVNFDRVSPGFPDYFHGNSQLMNRLILLGFFATITCGTAAQNLVRPCNAPACSQFDFWLGDWDLTWGDTSTGSNSVMKIMDSWVINENFNDPASHYRGMSWSKYDSANAVWKQTWVDNQGGYITLAGKFAAGEMVLYTEPGTAAGGKTVVSRMKFYNINAESFDWNWESTTDNVNWKVNWKIHYRRKR